ncbi:MAG: anthranilate synthase component I family protein [Bacteroidota bacterium]|nr:anthranilate synthase component I family protein [Bacteroidota bacterium]
MMRNKAAFRIGDASLCKQQMLSWANQFSICCFMDNHQYQNKYSVYDCIAAADAADLFLPQNDTLSQLSSFTQQHRGNWLFGHVGYDLKNEIEELTSTHSDKVCFHPLFFFQPKTILLLRGNVLTIESSDEKPEDVYRNVIESNFQNDVPSDKIIKLQQRISKEEYSSMIGKIKQHILRGDCYEMNFCAEFFCEDCKINPIEIFQNLSRISPTPFSAFYKLDDKYALCASPERFMQKQKGRLISQPIKGTAKRILNDETLDNEAKLQLQNSGKNKAENVMIADLVRNDMSKICRRGSVAVSELFGVYSYPQVHQMISTIKGEVDENLNISDALKALFPMGSMTGAPKKRVMQLIDEYELSKRGLYSGSIGYISPENNWDFNVVIRTILYNKSKRYLSFQTGSAITFESDAEEEYNECLLKAEAMRKALNIG